MESWDGGQDFFIEENKSIGGKLWWVGLAIGYGNLPTETVYDFVVCPILDDWFEQFTKEYCNE